MCVILNFKISEMTPLYHKNHTVITGPRDRRWQPSVQRGMRSDRWSVCPPREVCHSTLWQHSWWRRPSASRPRGGTTAYHPAADQRVDTTLPVHNHQYNW